MLQDVRSTAQGQGGGCAILFLWKSVRRARSACIKGGHSIQWSTRSPESVLVFIYATGSTRTTCQIEQKCSSSSGIWGTFVGLADEHGNYCSTAGKIACMCDYWLIRLLTRERMDSDNSRTDSVSSASGISTDSKRHVTPIIDMKPIEFWTANRWVLFLLLLKGSLNVRHTYWCSDFLSWWSTCGLRRDSAENILEDCAMVVRNKGENICWPTKQTLNCRTV